MKALGETEYQRQVSQLARRLGYTVKHAPNCKTRSGRWSSQGITAWPDLTLIRPPRLVFAELKGPDNPATPDQLALLALLGQCDGAEAYLWRSSEMSLQDVAELLAHRRNPSKKETHA